MMMVMNGMSMSMTRRTKTRIYVHSWRAERERCWSEALASQRHCLTLSLLRRGPQCLRIS